VQTPLDGGGEALGQRTRRGGERARADQRQEALLDEQPEQLVGAARAGRGGNLLGARRPRFGRPGEQPGGVGFGCRGARFGQLASWRR
jgi:hypothetical protein